MFNKRLYELRKICRITQKDLSDALGISPKSISSYERGIKEPDMSAIIKLAAFFNVSTDYLLCRTDFYTIKTITESAPLPEDERELLDLYKSCTPELKKYIIYKVGTIKFEKLVKQ